VNSHDDLVTLADNRVDHGLPAAKQTGSQDQRDGATEFGKKTLRSHTTAADARRNWAINSIANCYQ
jgi:hypothetical protein